MTTLRPHLSMPHAHPRRLLVRLEAVTAAAALVGGALLALRPDGSLLRADPAALAGTPFDDWRLPGLLLAGLVGVGYGVTAIWQRRGGAGARALSQFAGVGLIAFEIAELLWLGFQPLEVLLAAVGAAVYALATADEATTSRPG